VSTDTGMVVYGVNSTMKTLEAGAIENLIIYENLDFIRLTLKNKDTDSISVVHVEPKDLNNEKYYRDGESVLEL